MITMARARRQIFLEQHAVRDELVAVIAGLICVVAMAVMLILAARL